MTTEAKPLTPDEIHVLEFTVGGLSLASNMERRLVATVRAREAEVKKFQRAEEAACAEALKAEMECGRLRVRVEKLRAALTEIGQAHTNALGYVAKGQAPHAETMYRRTLDRANVALVVDDVAARDKEAAGG